MAPGPAPSIGRLFAPDSVWNAPLPDDARLDPESAPLIAAFASEAEHEGASGVGPFVQTGSYTTPIYVVGPTQSTVRVQIDTDQNSQWVDSLQGASNAVPIPANAQPAPGTDSQITIFQPSTDRMWEYWDTRKLAAAGTPVGGARSPTSPRARATTRPAHGPEPCRCGAPAPRACRSWPAR